jgi:hypothetical protein
MKKQKHVQQEPIGHDSSTAPTAQATGGTTLLVFVGLIVAMTLLIVYKFLFTQ